MAGLWSYSGSQVILGFPAKRQPAKQSSEPEIPLHLQRNSIISTYIDKCTGVTPKQKSLRKPWEALVRMSPIQREPEESRTGAYLPYMAFWVNTSIGLAWLLKKLVCSPTTCTNALDSMNT
ncbi:hypothetical protein TNCV_3168901 [Trichonephila clavipes]|nr:hypothetical protein TNCV_3168901 [Trichonephila clavipes]